MAEPQDVHSKRANAIQKARHLLHHAGYATGGKVRPEGGGENEPGTGEAGDESLQMQDGSAEKNFKRGGHAHGAKTHHRLDRKPRAAGGEASVKNDFIQSEAVGQPNRVRRLGRRHWMKAKGQ